MMHATARAALLTLGVIFILPALSLPVSADPGGHGNPHIPRIESTSIVQVVDPFNPDPTRRLYGTLDMMDLVKVEGEPIVVIAHEVFPSGTQGAAGQIPGFPPTSPDTYDGMNRGLGLGAVSAWNLRSGEFSFLIRPKDTAAGEPYDESRHTSGTDGVKATPWGTALIAEEWSQAPSATFRTPARGGHILEVDPQVPGRLSRIAAMGSFSHEGIAIQKVPGNFMIYQGDEQRGGGTWTGVPAVPSFACAGGTPRRGGALYRFTPHQRPVVFGDLQANGGALDAFDFLRRQWVRVPQDVVDAKNPDVIRCWADASLSPVSLWERPEDLEYDGVSQTLYFSVTEKSCGVVAGHCLVDGAGNTLDALGNPVSFDGARHPAGHVIRLDPDTGEWSVFVDAETVNTEFGIEGPVFGNPDNLVLDHEGRVYIAQDGGDPNDSIWIATPDKNRDGVADHFQRFLNMEEAGLGVPASSGEPTGFLFLTEKRLLFNWQGGSRLADLGSTPISRTMLLELGGASQ